MSGVDTELSRPVARTNLPDPAEYRLVREPRGQHMDDHGRPGPVRDSGAGFRERIFVQSQATRGR